MSNRPNRRHRPGRPSTGRGELSFPVKFGVLEHDTDETRAQAMTAAHLLPYLPGTQCVVQVYDREAGLRVMAEAGYGPGDCVDVVAALDEFGEQAVIVMMARLPHGALDSRGAHG